MCLCKIRDNMYGIIVAIRQSLAYYTKVTIKKKKKEKSGKRVAVLNLPSLYVPRSVHWILLLRKIV